VAGAILDENMYFKYNGRTNPDTGRNEPYLRLVESYRNIEDRVCRRAILRIGFAHEHETPGQLNHIARLLSERYQHNGAGFGCL